MKFLSKLLLAGMLSTSSFMLQAAPTITITIENHLFSPAEFSIPAHTKVRLLVINKDDSPEEFESYELNREKVIMGNSKAVIFIGPLAPGIYPFFGEFNPKTAQGQITVGE